MTLPKRSCAATSLCPAPCCRERQAQRSKAETARKAVLKALKTTEEDLQRHYDAANELVRFGYNESPSRFDSFVEQVTMCSPSRRHAPEAAEV